MKMYAYLILAVIVISAFLQPLGEVMMLCRDTLVVNRAVNDAVRAAKKESYTYETMKNAETGINEQIFRDEFSEIFGTALRLNKINNSHFTPTNADLYNDFYVDYEFDTERKGDRTHVNVTVSVDTEYKFKMQMLKDAEDIMQDKLHIKYKRKYNLILIN